MYVSVPKNYGGTAIRHEKQTVERPICKVEEPIKDACQKPSRPLCENCNEEKNPLSCLLSAFRGRGKSEFDSEDFLLIGLIALLMGREGNEDILLILAMLLLI